jgi:hypothetical protein
VQLGAWHFPPLQTPLTQSVGLVQPLLVPHFGQLPPPQSTSLSVPSFSASEQVAAAQMFDRQAPL